MSQGIHRSKEPEAVKAKILALVIAGTLGLFSFLEAAFGLCVACEIYPLVYRLVYSRKADYNI